ncbi:MAG: HAD family phosphatase [Chloroflexi bacterium]|nr:HAD family phosphatase [Chloroflexota bacterium]MCH8351108.1 HAD family phosphatase [Chloroflexota bacterium]MCI0781601.1 HAD family phosphatase [Chloroflexota bacterium]MCI0786950.1 HAD family phosphatase [Chloroflexota bacterium]MCI0799205.1 HAD family phosphatase [Chloroflexota bacterium]
MIRALVVDLDGTLIDRSERISARVARAVTQVSSRLPVTIATGREPADTLKYARQLGLTSPQVSDGGATILDPATGRILWHDPLDPQDAQEIVTRLDAMGAAFIATHPQGSLTQMSQVPHWNLIRVSGLDMEEEVADRVVAAYAGRDLQAIKVYLPYNGLWAVDFTRQGVDKATAITRLAGMLGVETGDMAAAGDSYNDIPMLRVCGVGIAMGDAPQELKDMADYIAPPASEDGLAVALEEFLLPRL